MASYLMIGGIEGEADPVNTHWTFFPLKGLEITDSHADLDAPIFGDATIFSYGRLPDLMKDALQHLGRDERLADFYRFDPQTHSVIAVKRTTENEIASSERLNQLHEDARHRAEELEAFFSLALLVWEKTRGLCGFTHRFPFRKCQTTIDLSNASITWLGNPYLNSPEREEPLKLREVELSVVPVLEPFISLAQFTCEPGKRDSRRASIGVAAKCLCSAFSQSSLIEYLLGAVTSCEILLTRTGEGFKTLKDRISSLLGLECLSIFCMKEVFDLRNRYLHQGYSSIPVIYAQHAVNLSLNVLFRYAQVAERFRSKEAILDYLDYLDKCERIRRHGPYIAQPELIHVQSLFDFEPIRIRF